QVEVAPVIAVVEVLALPTLEADVESDGPQHAHQLLVEVARMKCVALGLARSKRPWDVQISTRHSLILLLCYLANRCIIFWYNEKCDDFPLRFQTIAEKSPHVNRTTHRMRKTGFSGFVLLATLAPAAAASPLGNWMVEEQTAQIRIVD